MSRILVIAFTCLVFSIPSGAGDLSHGLPLASIPIDTPTLTGKITYVGTAVDDDDCTGDQGKGWWDSTDSQFEFCNANSGTPIALGAGGGAPTTSDYLVGTADAGLSGEIAVGTTPGGELGNTWASPTIDDGISIDAPTLTGKETNTGGTAVDDDDCTGEQGKKWWDSTDSAFEWCPANSGAPVSFGATTENHTATTETHVNSSININALATEVRSIYFSAHDFSTDGVFCLAPAEVTINSGPKTWSTTCADNDGSIIYMHTNMPDGWNNSTITIEVEYIQSAADTNPLLLKVSGECHGATETVDSTFGTEQSTSPTTVSGSNKIDTATSAAVTAAGTCAFGDDLWIKVHVDAAGTTTAMTTVNILGVKLEYTTNIGD